VPRFVQSLEAFSSPVGVLDPDVVKRDQREKLTVWQLDGIAGISAQGGMMSCMALELLRSGSAGLLDILLLLSFADVCGLYEK
jgi:hypothetical protein